jgi:hypothetical protein
MTIVELPPRKSRQSLNGYVRENLERFEREVSVGVPYESLAEAALAAGFSKVAVLSLHSAMYRARKRRPKRSHNAFAEAVQRMRLAPASPNMGAQSAEDDDLRRLGSSLSRAGATSEAWQRRT